MRCNGMAWEKEKTGVVAIQTWNASLIWNLELGTWDDARRWMWCVSQVEVEVEVEVDAVANEGGHGGGIEERERRNLNAGLEEQSIGMVRVAQNININKITTTLTATALPYHRLGHPSPRDGNGKREEVFARMCGGMDGWKDASVKLGGDVVDFE
ncbi:uncharacterized protein STEHIDRAFT_116388 [Stereum hirsutum FP-91666 SS1]|uniref:Uncharacterized protein n=1 Tax=Stereum hirsutum (strain FP-91666) TaxID=721885 RepID=R7RWE6_STEHR|nr:uncharacterized protein STEHIDRAFT_116388 [Stereum hirsutum FP-91666 SS1]EIM79686.1 hypothetical protein STEHIDRAFT_116388 [Stereum hirsutum FP-91666 SS1]